MPRKRSPQCAQRSGAYVGFNEAGALCPGKGMRSGENVIRTERGFNEAGALCPGKGPTSDLLTRLISRLQ